MDWERNAFGFIRVVGARCAQCWDLRAAEGSSEKMGVLAVLVVPGGQTEVQALLGRRQRHRGLPRSCDTSGKHDQCLSESPGPAPFPDVRFLPELLPPGLLWDMGAHCAAPADLQMSLVHCQRKTYL